MKRMLLLAMLASLLQAGHAQISVIGTATPAGDWDTDYDMVQDAGNPSVFRLNMYLATGELKFREGHDWTTNWGNTNFPSGTAILGGPNIPVTAGFYTITFDTTTLAYLFSSGNVGINNQDPAVSLDIAGALAHRSAHLDVTGMEVTLPANVSLVKLTGSPPGPVLISGPGAADGQRVVLLNATSTDEQVMAFDAAHIIEPGETREFTYVAGEGWKPLSAGLAGNNDFWIQDGANQAIRNANPDGFYSAHGTTVVSDPGPITLPVEGEGTRLMWIPEKSALRVGTVLADQWNAGNIGVHSIACGLNTIASGSTSMAMGYGAFAAGDYAFSMGYGTEATSDGAIATGVNTNAFGAQSASFNFFTTASGSSATAMGHSSVAAGSGSIATGLSTKANGNYSLAAGNLSRADGWGSAAFGTGTVAKSLSSMVLGAYNDSIAASNPTMWVSDDPLFIVGNGASNTSRANAVTILKNGNVGIGNSADTKNPEARLVIDQGAGGNQALHCRGTFMAHGTEGGFPSFYFNSRMMWIPSLSAFRAGDAGAEWGAGQVGVQSVAFGRRTTASGARTLACGDETTASGTNSTSFGVLSEAQGYASEAHGVETISRGYSSTALGMYNDPILASGETTPSSTTPLFIIGNGDPGSPSNALTVRKNGNVGIGNAPSAKTPTARLVVDGYTRLGTTPENAPAIKMKKLTGTGPVTDGTKAIVHGLDAAKILSVSVLMEYGLGPGETIPPKYTTSTGYEYEYQVRTNDIFLLNKAGNSANINERPLRILITYEE